MQNMASIRRGILPRVYELVLSFLRSLHRTKVKAPARRDRREVDGREVVSLGWYLD